MDERKTPEGNVQPEDEAREARLEKLRAAISSGTYEVSATLVADRILQALDCPEMLHDL